MVYIIIVLLMCIALGWSIGANDAANSMGTAVGANVMTLRQAIILVSVCGFLGAYFQGANVMKTIGNGIVQIDALEKNIALYIVISACIGACLWVVIATYFKMPISTSHSIVGAMAGGGLALGVHVEWRMLLNIFICWILTPVGSAVLGFTIYKALSRVAERMLSLKYFQKTIKFLIIISACYLGYTWGANDVANATGVIVGTGVFSAQLAAIIGGAAIVFGIVTWGYRVINTVGSNITNLIPIMAFVAQLASALNVHMYTLIGIPVSTSHSIVGAIFGVGLVRGIKVINMRIFKEILFCWLATPFASGVITFLTLKCILFFAA